MWYLKHSHIIFNLMVKFNKEIDHWIYSNNKPNKFDSIVSLDSLKNKINKANG